MAFIIVLILTTLAVASAAAFFSVWGLAHLFTGSMVPVIIMGSALEAGKLVAASFLYRYNKIIKAPLKAYLASAVLILMIITSMGIFGYLSAAYQKDTLPLAEMQQKIELYSAEEKQLIERKAQIDKQIADVGPNYVRAKQRLQREFKPELDRIDARLSELTPELQKLKTDNVNVQAKVGPIMFIAEVLNKDPNQAVFIFILILISVFDPLAVALTIATNIAIKNYKDEKKAENEAKEKTENKQKVNMVSLQQYVNQQVEKKLSEKQPEPTPQILNETP